jgi:RND superfamily putative drug exporter
VPALAAMIGQKNWWPSHLGKNAAQVYAAHQKKQQQLGHLTDHLVRMKVIPRRDTLTTPSSSTRDGVQQRERRSTVDDLLVRLKLVPPGHKPGTASRRRLPATGVANGRASDKRTASDSPSTNGERSIERLPDHALPLFDLSGLPRHLTDDLKEPALDSPATTNGNGKRETDRYLGHSLPLFGQDFPSHQPITLGTNGNGHTNAKANGNGHGEQPIEDDLGSPLPLFGTNALSGQATSGNGEHPAR